MVMLAKLVDGPGLDKVYGMSGTEPLRSIQVVCPLDYPVCVSDDHDLGAVDLRRITYELAGWDGEHWLYKAAS